MKKITQILYMATALLFAGSMVVSAQPTTSAPTPSVDAARVVSVFSNAYTNVAGTNYFPNWGQTTTYEAVTVGASDNVIKYANMNYQGIQFGSTQDISAMKYLHIDIWTNDANAATFPVTLIWGAEKTITKTVATNGTWTSLDIPLSEFTGAVLTNAIQFKFQSNEWFTLGAAGSSSKYTTIYLDNLYFWTDVAPALTVSANSLTINQPANSTKNFDITTSGSWTVTSNQSWLTASSAAGTGNATITLTAQENPAYITRSATVTVTGGTTTKNITVTQSSLIPASAPVPNKPSTSVKSIYSDTYSPAVTVTAFDNWWDMIITDCTFSTGDNGKIMKTTAGGNCGSPTFNGTPLNVIDMTQIHVDVFPISAMDIGLKLVTVANGESAGWVSLGTLTPLQWNSISIPLSSFAMTAKTDVKQVGFVTTNSFGTFYMDNLYFHSNTTSLNNAKADKSTLVYPTTVLNILNIESNDEIHQVIVYDLVGQAVKSQTGSLNSIDLSNLSKGNYLVNISMKNGLVSTHKIVKL